MTTVDIITTQAAAASAGRWPEFAAAYRVAQAAFASLEQSTDDDEAEAAHDAFAPLYHRLLAYPVRLHAHVGEKAALLNLDCWDKAAAFDALSGDLARLLASPARTTWDAAVAAFEAAGSAEAWRDLIDTAAPDAAATAYKIAAYINRAHADETGDAASNPDTLQRLLAETKIDGAFGVVRLLRDACLQAGIAHPITMMTADA